MTQMKPEMKCCPIRNTLRYIGKKWSLSIINNLFSGKKHFSEFLEANEGLSTKMLSTRLKDLEKVGIIEKRVTNTTPVVIEYHLTEKGRKLNKILYETAVFSMSCCSEEVLNKADRKRRALAHTKKFYNIQ